jgi:hypothetical protein
MGNDIINWRSNERNNYFDWSQTAQRNKKYILVIVIQLA